MNCSCGIKLELSIVSSYSWEIYMLILWVDIVVKVQLLIMKYQMISEWGNNITRKFILNSALYNTTNLLYIENLYNW